MKSKLLIETISADDAHIIAESSVDGKSTYLVGTFMQSEIKNRNGRIYPIAEVTKAVDTAKQTIEEHGGIFGELDHPQTLMINLDRISHVIKDMRMEGNNAVGKAQIIDTPMGNIAKELVKSGVKIGVSSRGAGSVNEGGGVSDFNFVTIDLVATPSAPGATPMAVYESLLDSKRGCKVVSLAEQLKEDATAQKYFKKAILDFLNEGLFAKK